MQELVAAGTDLMTWVQGHGLLASLIVVMMVTPGLLCCWAAQRGIRLSRTEIAQVNDRVSRLHTAVEMLTDTTEGGLQTVFAEIEKLSSGQAHAMQERAGRQTRVRSAARNGETARTIAVREGVSEGEVHLRLQLSERTRGAAGVVAH